MIESRFLSRFVKVMLITNVDFFDGDLGCTGNKVGICELMVKNTISSATLGQQLYHQITMYSKVNITCLFLNRAKLGLIPSAVVFFPP